MRRSTLTSIFLLVLFIPTYFSKEIVAFAGFPDMGLGTARAVVGLIAIVCAVLVLTILTLLNPRIRDWRKERGRDIEEEERYESDHGMISLTPKEEDINEH